MVGPSSNSFYTNLRDGLVINLLKQYGFDAAILVKQGEVFDPVTGGVTVTATTTAYPCKAVYGGGRRGRWPGVIRDTASKTLTRQQNTQVFVDASILTIDVNTDMKFQDENGLSLEILKVEKINPGGPNVMWVLEIDK